MTNGVQRVSISGDKPGTPVSLPAVGSNLSGLDSSYTAYWYGPWLGVSIDYKINKKFNLTTGCEYHWVEYFAEANWNLRSDFDHPNSFEHETVGTGIVWNITGEYLFSEKWSWLLGANIQSWETAAGSVRTFNADGSVGKTRLNEVNWSSYAFKTGIVYRF